MSKENPGNTVNLLCEGTVIVGDIKTKNDIRVDGMIKGKIITTGRLVVGSTAKLEGNVDCVNIDVQRCCYWRYSGCRVGFFEGYG